MTDNRWVEDVAARDRLDKLDPQGGSGPSYVEVHTSACHAGSDGDCSWTGCPQTADGEPAATGRHCPLDAVSRTARQEIDRAMDEDSLLLAIVEAALFLGWRVHHDRRSDKALQQGSPGFPDLVLARGHRVLFVECKTATGRLTEDQLAWGLAIPEDLYWIVRPSDLDTAIEGLA